MLRPAVFLDRDDTINRNADLPDAAWGEGKAGDLLDAEYVHLLPGVLEACRRLRRAGYTLVVITNQGGLARGGGSLDDLDQCNDALRDLLPAEDAPGGFRGPAALRRSLIDAFYACPFHPAGQVARFADEHEWRKPSSGMVDAACRELGIDPERSWMIGDKQRDLDAAIAAGIPEDRCIMVGAGKTAEDLAEAAELVLAGSAPKPTAQAPPTIAAIPATRVSLTASDGHPLRDERVRETVLATAAGIAERTGVELLDIEATDCKITAILAAGRLPALGFMTELRRVTNDWHQSRAGIPLWNEREDDESF